MEKFDPTMLKVVLTRDPNCLTRQACSAPTRWERLTGHTVYSGPSLLAQISCPCEVLTASTPQASAGCIPQNVLTEGLKLAENGIYQFRTHPTLGCKGCPVRAYDNAPERENCRSTCGSIVEFTPEILSTPPDAHLKDSVVLATVRLVGKGYPIKVRDSNVKELLKRANCATLDRFEVE